jgi:hypothetical protein
MGRACSAHGAVRKSYRILVGKPEGKRPLGSPRRSWDDNVNMGLRKIGLEGVDWIHLAQDWSRCLILVNTVMNFRVP